MTNIEIVYLWTKDKLRLQGIHYLPKNKDICVLFIHGMSGNFTENYFAHILGQKLINKGIGFLYGHNRGYSHINDITVNKLKKDGGYRSVRIGASYEKFEECIYDIEAWKKQCFKLGYKRIILLGHSLGGNKTIYYFSKEKPKDVIGLVLASPPDLLGLVKKPEYQSNPNYEKLLKEARRNVKKDKPKKLLPTIWNWYQFSSQTFLNLFEEGGPANNLPVLRNPKEFKELATIDVPILAIMGENDDIAIRTLKKDLDLIAKKALNCPSFSKRFIKDANHNYERQEEKFAKVVLKWILNNFSKKKNENNS